jgi:hypothetical protein
MFVQIFGLTYSWLNENLVSPFVAFTRGFEFALIFMAAALFFAISVFLLLRQARRLPKSYTIEIVNLYGEQVSIDGVRQTFATHDAAESYARMYRGEFGHQYLFKVAGTADPGKS